MPRAVLFVLDSLGIGALPDAADFGDAGADTLGHIAAHCARGLADVDRSGPLQIPNLERLGLGLAAALVSGTAPAGLSASPALLAGYAAARERSTGKDTTSGHWEMCAVPVLAQWGYFRAEPNSMPAELLDALAARFALPGWLGNCHASGTQIIADLGSEHIASGKPIVYTSADSVVQFACHEQSFGLERLYALCAHARTLCDRWRIGRVIARPFTGDPRTGFRRTPHRRDYSMSPPAPTLLDLLLAAGVEVIAVGKIADIFANQGISRKVLAHGLDGLFEASLDALRDAAGNALVFTNFVDFDAEYGHRRDLAGYARALERFDHRLPELLAALRADDLLLVTADHGNDPTWYGSDHTREHIPILARGPGIGIGNHGLRASFADIGQTLARHFGIAPLAVGRALQEPA